MTLDWSLGHPGSGWVWSESLVLGKMIGMKALKHLSEYSIQKIKLCRTIEKEFPF